MGKYSERCKAAEGIVFIPLVVDLFGKWYKDAVEKGEEEIMMRKGWNSYCSES
mgnify:CR=1 FL=1